MTEEEAIAIQESHTHSFCHVEPISFDTIPFYEDDKMGNAVCVRGVHFAFGHIFAPRLIDGTLQQSFHFSIQCLPRVEAGKNWQCATKTRFSIYSIDEKTGEEVLYFERKRKYSLFCVGADACRLSSPKLTIKALLAHFPDRKFLARIQLNVDTPTGLQFCLLKNTTLYFGEDRVLVNKEFLTAHSDYFKRYYKYENSGKLGFGTADYFQIVYQLLEFGKCEQLDDDTAPLVIQLANIYNLDKVETIAMEFVNRRGSKITLPEKYKVLDAINADASKRIAIKRAKHEIGSSPTKYFRGLTAAKRLSSQQIEEIGRILMEPK